MRLLLRNPEFRAVALTELLSVLGDQLSRVALALLVFGRTGSAALSGLTYALTYLPTVAGSLLLSPVADRRPRREILIAIDGLRAVLLLCMGIPGAPLPALCVLVATSAFLTGPYQAARLAMLRDILPQEQYGAGMAVRQSLNQGAMLAGFASGGFLAITFTPSTCLLIDSGTFALSALIVTAFVRRRPAARPGEAARSVAPTFRLIGRTPTLRAIYLMTFSALFFIAPEALAVALVAERGLDPRWTGLFMASAGLFSVVILPLFAKFVTAAHYPMAFPIACVAPGLPLLAVAALDNPYLIMVVMGVSGAMWAVLIVISVSTFAQLLPDDQRARGMGIAASTNGASHGVGALLAGLMAELLGAGTAVTLLGLASLFFAAAPILLWSRAQGLRAVLRSQN